MQYYKFVSHDVPPVENVLVNRIPEALAACDAGDYSKLKELHIATQDPVYRCAGWAFPYREYMRRFWVKIKYYGIIEVYALNRTDIRREYKSEVIKIVEVEQ